jgi:hypothetical protein
LTPGECCRITDYRAGLGDRTCRRCEKCGSAGPLSHHHRIKRSHGGEWLPSNIVVLCGSGTTGCHGWVEHHPAEANALGWALQPHEDPLVVPVFHYPLKMRVQFDDEGMLIPV